METRENSKLVQTFSHEQRQYPSRYISFTFHYNNLECNTVQKNNARTNRGNSNTISFVASDASFRDVPLVLKEHPFEMSESDSCSENDDVSDEEVTLDELLNDGKAKKKIELLAAMVGVDTKEPPIVLTQVVRVLKHLNHCYTTTTT